MLEYLRCLSDMTRARIFHLLARRGPELCVCDLIAALGLPQSTISRQLMMLRYLGLVKDRREAVWMHYSLAKPESEGHRLVVNLMRRGFNKEPVFSEDLARFDKLKVRGKVLNRDGRCGARTARPRGTAAEHRNGSKKRPASL
ncbi:MAG: metalloregulator ArsR/SmtB family transcription factor [bacterium]|nr:metalloregulator ArsR/SmtB family transcription factor [Candidatus Sumerlaeota bacterium]